jgi:uncharacterized protein YecE (DUF72 family)
VLYDPPRRLCTDYRIGLSAWTDKSMLEEGQFYPYKTMPAEERLWWYSRYFDVVEVNSTFYALLSPDTSATWVARTPPAFLFIVKAFGLLTGHDVDLSRLPDTLKENASRGRTETDRRARSQSRVRTRSTGMGAVEARERATAAP